MKKETGVFIFVFLALMVMGAIQPGLLYSGESSEGTLWDSLLEPGPYVGTKWVGPLSIYYEFLTGKNSLCLNENKQPDPGNPKSWLYFTVRLVQSQGGGNYPFYMKSASTICKKDIAGQKDAAWLFLNDVVVPWLPGSPKQWTWKTIENAVYDFENDGGVFVADISIAVK